MRELRLLLLSRCSSRPPADVQVPSFWVRRRRNGQWSRSPVRGRSDSTTHDLESVNYSAVGGHEVDVEDRWGPVDPRSSFESFYPPGEISADHRVSASVR